MKSLKYLAMMMAVAGFVACDDDNEVVTNNGNGGNGDNGDNPPAVVEPVSNGFVVLNSGNQSKAIEGDFTLVNYAGGFSATNNVFAGANGRSLGITPNSACVYGSKVYVAVTKSNTIEVCERGTFKSLKRIELAADAVLADPRGVAADGGYVYVSLYSGHVCKIDTTNLNIVGSVEVGDKPELMAVSAGKLYVPNSGYGQGTTVSEIDLATFSKTRDITVPKNPVKLDTDARGNVYLLCSGYYDESWNQLGAAVHRLDLASGNHVKVADATIMDIPDGTNTLYVCNYPYGAPAATYAKVDLMSGAQSALSITVDAPNALAVDPVTGYMVVLSYELVGGFASYSTPGYARIFNADGTQLKQVETGVGPLAVCFLTENL